MASPVIVDGDLISFFPQFGPCTVTLETPPPNVVIGGCGHAMVGDKKVAIQGDEAQVEFDATYITSTHPIAGQGKVTIQALHSSQIAPTVGSELPMLLIGNAPFTALFTPTVPAKMPPPLDTPEPDLSPKLGQGQFHASQVGVTVG
ncbi:hypothetical protein BCU22_022450 (plasmid) [Vibrio cyclitrophicus]|uniref:hypothetical protein n=1 Tax=Vibrio cyclitrophicus TaxID=47951 RepID=UPI000C82EF38|nr:hypothetical protein [Vibrio cyclitrophicus]PMJ43421.1 hypothetical protein BCU22_09710 [Vibrio cyclitrophicus]